ncbi:MAG: MotA/TolQ/ExbB proton channel family protein [Methanobacteriaceae archaeon]|jgi:biopolymer transport protein ExbB/TolQ|nr:MotA/TolQ/ExbB proton channel family protein [Methanobacteriaceae archaeon]
MTSVIPGGEYLTGALNAISQSFLIPVIILLLVIIVATVIIAGGLISEYTSRKNIPVTRIRDIIFDINKAESSDEIKNIVENSEIPNSQKKVLYEVADSSDLDHDNREALARKLIEDEENKIDKTLEKTDIITRVGPTLGLMGTLIPMGPGLAALGSGDINTLADAIIVAFDTTVVGIGAGGLAYVISKIRKRWYEEYISDLDALVDSVLDFMKK